jgi:hypothetical protein
MDQSNTMMVQRNLAPSSDIAMKGCNSFPERPPRAGARRWRLKGCGDARRACHFARIDRKGGLRRLGNGAEDGK